MTSSNAKEVPEVIIRSSNTKLSKLPQVSSNLLLYSVQKTKQVIWNCSGLPCGLMRSSSFGRGNKKFRITLVVFKNFLGKVCNQFSAVSDCPTRNCKELQGVVRFYIPLQCIQEIRTESARFCIPAQLRKRLRFEVLRS